MNRPGFEDAVINCPYNKSHQILKSRFLQHLVKCRQRFPDVNMRTCISFFHVIPEADYDVSIYIYTCVYDAQLENFPLFIIRISFSSTQHHLTVCEACADYDRARYIIQQ